MFKLRRSIVTCALILIALSMSISSSFAQGNLVSIFVVRHPETDASQASQPVVPLSEAGKQRAQLLAPTLRDIKFTHMFASHTTRSRQAIEGAAAKHGLPIVQLPAPGSQYEGQPVTDQTTRRAPIDPIAGALVKLPAGSIALVGLNSENIYAILNKLGVPVAAEGKPCAHGSMCVPCTNNSCFPRDEFDSIWYLVRDQVKHEPVTYAQFRYAAGWRPTSP